MDPLKKDIMILLLGQTGAGKSTFLNCAAGAPIADVGHDLHSCTSIINHFILPHKGDQNRRIVFVDTPGFNDTWADDIEILGRIITWLKSLHEFEATFGGIIYLHDITQSREIDGANFMTPTKFFRPPHAIFVTTKWNSTPSLNKATLARRKQQLEGVYWKIMMDQGARVARFDDTPESAWSIVDSVLEEDPVQLSAIQKLLSDIHGNLAAPPKRNLIAGFFSYIFGAARSHK